MTLNIIHYLNTNYLYINTNQLLFIYNDDKPRFYIAYHEL